MCIKEDRSKNYQAGKEYTNCKSTEAQPIAYKKQGKKKKRFHMS